MKRYLITLSVLAFIVPSIALASWWNPLSWFNGWSFHKTEVPQSISRQDNNLDASAEKIKELQQEIDDLKKQQSNSNSEKNTPTPIKTNTSPIVITTPPIVTPPVDVQPSVPLVTNAEPQRVFYSDGSLNLSVYNALNVADYVKNHKASLNKPAKIVSGMITSFSQGNSNYISIVDTNDISSVINLQVDNENDYTNITNELVKYDLVLIYGYGEDNKTFNVVGGGGSYENSEPVINLDAIYKCKSNSMCLYPYNAGVENIFSKKSK